MLHKVCLKKQEYYLVLREKHLNNQIALLYRLRGVTPKDSININSCYKLMLYWIRARNVHNKNKEMVWLEIPRHTNL